MSANFFSKRIDEIVIVRSERQRAELPDLTPLAHSISENGLLNPVIIDENDVLIAGESRLTACRDILNWTHITVQLRDDCSPEQLFLIELEENLKRTDLHWRDQCHAINNYHRMCVATHETWSRKQTAAALGISTSELTSRIDVSIGLEQGIELVVNADRYSTARNAIVRNKARRAEAAAESLSFTPTPPPAEKGPYEHESFEGPSDEAHPDELADQAAEAIMGLDVAADLDKSVVKNKPIPFRNEDFHTFAASYDGPKFNFLHCDFPYGVNAGKHKMGASQEFGGYEDSPDVYWDLIQTLHNSMDTLVAESAHMMFWFSMDFYTETKELLSDMGWKVNPFPLYWHKTDNSGIMPDPQRGPRRITETALFCSRGDRFVVQPVANTIGHPNTKDIHMSEKPIPMLQHFFRMFVDESTRMLDPTMGSGNAVVLAEDMNAASALGLEMSEEFYKNAVAKYVSQD